MRHSPQRRSAMPTRCVRLLAALLLLLWAAPAWASPVASGAVTMDDGVQLAYDLYEPGGAAPVAGWPAVVVQHGLGGSKDTVASIAEIFAAQGYAALAYSSRGHGTSGGDVGLVGPREVQDSRLMVAWLEARPEVSDTLVGCWGISYGGGQCWNAAPTGIYKAIDVVETWTDLYAALWPQNVAKTGVIGGLATTVASRSPLIRGLLPNALAGTNLGPIRTLTADRSILAKLGSVQTPVAMFQGRQDFAFDIDQAKTAFARLTAPKKLYVGAFGHFPSTFPGPDSDYVFSQSVAWLDRFVKGSPNGVDTGPNVAIADRTGTRRATYAGLPKTKVVGVGFRGTAATRVGPRLGQALETFGQAVLRVQVTSVSPSFRRLVAVVSAGGKVVTHGAVVPQRGLNTIRLADYAYFLPKGTRLTLALGPDSGSSDITYASPTAETSGSIRLGAASLSLQTLSKPVSR
jgi:alpha-beta hydrolase superfamily lysophospholipase